MSWARSPRWLRVSLQGSEVSTAGTAAREGMAQAGAAAEEGKAGTAASGAPALASMVRTLLGQRAAREG